MENWPEEAKALGARLAVQHLALKALVHSHPDPAALLDAWRSLQADSVIAAYAPSGGTRSGEWLTAKVQALADEWTAELAAATTRRRRTASVRDPEGA